MAKEEAFNRFASNELVREYEHETGIRLRFKHLGTPFPDVFLETVADKQEIGVEFVEVGSRASTRSNRSSL